MLSLFNKEEWKSFLLIHISWLQVVYRFFPIYFIGLYYSVNEIVELEKYEIVFVVIDTLFSNVIKQLFLEKRNYWVGFKAIYLMQVCVVFGVFIVSSSPLVQLSAVFSLLESLFYLAREYGSLYKPVREGLLNVLYAPYCLGFLFLGIYYNPFDNVILSYYITTLIFDFVWFILTALVLFDKKFVVQIFRSKWSDEFSSVKLASSRGYSEIIHLLAMLLGSSVVLFVSEPTFALGLYIIVRRLPLFSIVKAIVQQVKRWLVTGVSVRMYRTLVLSYLAIAIEISVVTIISVYSLGGEFVLWQFGLILVVYLLTGFVEIFTRIKELYLLYQKETGLCTTSRLLSSSTIAAIRVVYNNPLIMYIPNLVAYVILLWVYGMRLKLTNYEGIPSYLVL